MNLTHGVNVTVTNPTPPVAQMQAPDDQVHLVVPYPGPPGPPGAGGATDESIASVLADPNSQTRAVLPPVIESVVEPPIDLTVLLENTLA